MGGGGRRGGGKEEDERSGKVRRDEDRWVDEHQRSQDGGGQLRHNRVAAHCVTVTKLGAEAPHEKELLIWAHCCRGSIHQGQECMEGQHKPHVMDQEARGTSVCMPPLSDADAV